MNERTLLLGDLVVIEGGAVGWRSPAPEHEPGQYHDRDPDHDDFDYFVRRTSAIVVGVDDAEVMCIVSDALLWIMKRDITHFEVPKVGRARRKDER